LFAFFVSRSCVIERAALTYHRGKPHFFSSLRAPFTVFDLNTLARGRGNLPIWICKDRYIRIEIPEFQKNSEKPNASFPDWEIATSAK